MKPHRQTFPTIFTTILLELRIYGNSIARHWFDSKWQEGRGTSTRVAQLSANSPLQFQILWPRKLVARFHVFLFKWLQHYYSGWNLVRKQPHLLTIVSIYREQRFTSVSYIFSDNFHHANNFLIVFTFLAVSLVVLFERSKFVRSSGFNCCSYRSVHCYSSFFFFFFTIFIYLADWKKVWCTGCFKMFWQPTKISWFLISVVIRLSLTQTIDMVVEIACKSYYIDTALHLSLA